MLQLKAMQLSCCPPAWLMLCLTLQGLPAKGWADEKSPPHPPAKNIHLEDRLAAVVNGEAILLSQLRFEARLSLLRTGVPVEVLERIPKNSWPALLDMVIAHRLWAAANEKTELSVEQLGAVALMNEQLRKAFGSEAVYQQFLHKHDMDSTDVQSILERIVRAESNLQAKVRLRAEPNEAEIQKAREALPDLNDAQLRAKLFEEKFKLLSAQELETQRKKADVRILLKFPSIEP